MRFPLRLWLWTTLGLLVVAVGIAIGKFSWDRRPIQLVANILALPNMPASLRHADCVSPFTTDVVTACSFDVNPTDFPQLLKARGFSAEAMPRSIATTQLVRPHVGPEFIVDAEYSVMPPEFKHGGIIQLFTNAARDRGLLYYYEE